MFPVEESGMPVSVSQGLGPFRGPIGGVARSPETDHGQGDRQPA